MADNMVTLVGTLGTEPELRTTPQGADVVTFRLATNERRRNPEGDGWVDGPTSWFRISAWNQLGRNAHASLHKGQRAVVQGVLRIAEFTTEAHGTSRTAEVKASAVGHDLAFGTTAFTRNGQPAAPQALPAQQPAAAQVPAPQPVAEARALEPVGGGWGAPLVAEDETPF
jgi:single-strand DNA-binding protein